MNDPAWQAITPELVPHEQHAAAVALNSAGFNVARAIGPALGGMVIARADSGTAFLLNAVSFFGVILVLYHWKRPAPERIETGALWDAVRGGYPLREAIAAGALSADPHRRFQRGSDCAAGPAADSGASIWRDRLWSCCWAASALGALAGATILPRLRRKLSVDGLVATAIVVFAGMTFAAGRISSFGGLCAALATAGAAWIGILACLNTAAQTMCPSWVRARALSMYLLVLQGGMAIGSTLWGALATRVGFPNALLCSALALIAGLATIRKASIELPPPGNGAVDRERLRKSQVRTDSQRAHCR